MQLTGTAANDVLVGSTTEDTLDGGAGDDTLNGGFGNDSVSGGDGNDLFQLDYGNDTLRGGSGADIFTFNSATGNDRIVDFSTTLDRINTSGWAALNGVRFFLDVSGDTLITIAGVSNITLQGVTQAQWGSIREADGSALYTPSTTPTDDYAASTATTGRVTVGDTGTSGRIETGSDTDWFAVDVTAGTSYTFTLNGFDGGGGTLPDPYLRLMSATGTLLTSDDDGGPGLDSQITYTPTATGRLYLMAGGFLSGDTGSYRLSASVNTPSADDYADTTATTGRVTVGGAAATGNIETSGDKDWFAVDVTAGTRYRFTLSGTGDGGGTLSNPYLELLSPAGLRQAFDDDTGPGSDSLLIYTATSTGRLYLSASASSISPTATGTYRLLAETVPDDYTDNSGTVGTIMAGGSVTGTIEISGDKDWFAIDVTQGTQYRFNLSGRDGGGGTVADPNLELRSSTGSVLAADYDGGTGLDSQMTYTATSTGRLYVAVSAGTIFTPNTGSYRLSASTVEVVDDYAGSSATTGVVAVGGSVTGNLEVLGDSDWFAADLVAGTRYIVSLSGRDGGGGTLLDPLLQVRSSTGLLLHEDDDSGVGSGSELSFVATTTGRYYFAASGYDGAYTGTYQLSLTTPPPDDYAGSTATTGQLAVGDTVSGRLEVAADQDWFAIDLVAGKTYSFTLSGLDGGGGSLDDPWLRLLDANGTRLAFDDDGGTGTDSLLTFTATVSGRYYLSAEGASDTETGTYRLSAVVEEPPPADPAGVRGGTPSDPLFAQQWHLGGTFGINVLPVWADYTGVGIRVGVLDQGIEARHRDLDDNLLTALSTVAASGAAGGTPLLTDDNHGTAVAGVIAAERNGFGGVGVAYNADLVSYYDPLNSGTAVFAATTAATYLRSIGAVDVLNNSWGFGNFFKSTPNRAFLDDFDSTPFNVSGAALARLAAEGRGGKGTVVVQSAGNTGEYGDDTNLHNFQNSRFVITVAATTSTGALASFSTPGASVLVAAPGVGIVTSDRTGSAGYATGDSTSLDGTSFSAPAVAGVVALMLEANADLGYRDVQEILALSARTISPSASSWISNGATGWNGGGMHFSEGFGFGLVDARAAVRLAETWLGQQTRANEASLTASRTLSPSLAIPDNNLQGVSSTVDLAGDVTIDRVEIDLNITHSWIGDLRITLTSPSGTAINLVDRPGQGRLSNLGSSQDNVNFTFGVTGLMGERAGGTWTLTLSDRDGGIVGSLESWSLRAYGETGSADDNHVFTDEFVSLLTAAASRGTITDTDGGTDTLNAAAVTGAVSFDLGAGTGSIAGRAITLTANAFERAIGGDAADTLTAGSNAAALLGGRGADTLTGGAGFDTLTGGAGDDRLIGGDGLDFAVFAGDRSAFTLTRDGDGFLLTGTEGSDHLSGVELAVFNRGAIFLGGAGASLFDEAGYLAANPDVAAAVRAGALSSGQSHYEAFGRAEGRPGAGGLSLFDEAFYLSRYADIASAVRNGVFESGYAHYQMYGRAEGRNPSLYFDTDYYLTKNPDVAGAVRAGTILAVDHYLNYGLNEGREASPYFNAADYLRINPDVAAAGLNAVRHFLTYGYTEGRLAGIDWDYIG